MTFSTAPGSAADKAGDKSPIYLLDSMSFIFRAYHAMQRQRPMSTRTGVPTAATYVFVNMINKLRRDFNPEFFAAVFDVSAPVFRDERAKAITSVRKWNVKTQKFDEIDYLGYKANRTEMPADLAQQLPFIRRALEAYKIPILQAEGFEADDVIGTLSSRAASEGRPVYIVSNDKDMLQLVNDTVKVLNPAKDNLILDRAKVEEVLGVPPERVVDVMALRGDSIDNVPGAPGIGDKGSVELIQQFGSVEAALENTSAVKRKTYRESLENNRDTILLSKELVTIHCEVPVDVELDAMRVQQPDAGALRQLFTELEFTTLLKELSPAPTQSLRELNLNPQANEITDFLERARKEGFAFSVAVSGLGQLAEQVSDAEKEAVEEEIPLLRTMSLLDSIEEASGECEPQQAKIGVALAEGKALLVPLSDELKNILEDNTVRKQVHDLKASIRELAHRGVVLRGVQHDIMLLSYLINPTHTSHRLSDLAARFTPAALAASGDAALAESACVIRELAPLLDSDVEKLAAGNVYRTIDLPLAPILNQMEIAGVRIDLPLLGKLESMLNGEMMRVGELIYDQSGHRFNINSPKQLGDILFNKMNLPKPLKYGKGKVVSTAQDVLEELALKNEVPRLVLEFRQLAKLKSNYVDTLPLLADGQGRVHTTFNQVGTATGRLSSTNPNLQNIPIRTELGRQIRAAFIAAPGRLLIAADYSQIELRLMAHFSEDPLLLKAFRNNEDIHTLTASEVFGVPQDQMDKETRNRAKAVNFGIVYGISPFGLAAQLGIAQGEARAYIERYFERYHGVRRFIDEVLEQTRKDQMVRTMFGRVRPIPDIQSRNQNLRGFAERTAVNTPLQGTAADLIKIAMIRIDERLRDRGLKAQMILQVHDELLFDAPQEEVDEVQKLVKQEMEGVVELKVPLIAEAGVGKNWRELK